MSPPTGIAFYDLDGTLVSSNIVVRYAYYARNYPSKFLAVLKFSKLIASVPFFIGLDFYSRRLFNEVFYREYRRMDKDWLKERAEALFEEVVRPTIYPGSTALVEQDRSKGYRLVLLTGELDFILAPIVRYFGFDDLISNSLVYRNGTATGEIVPPLIAEEEKVTAMLKLCRQYNVDPAQSKAYSDSFSDVPMLDAVGQPAAVNPDRRLWRVARARGWPVLDLKKGGSGE